MRGSKATRWVLFAGIALRLALWCFQSSPEGDDGMRYLSESVNMVRHGVFSTASFLDGNGVPTPSAHDLPLWPGVMAVYYRLTDSVRWTQYLAGLTNIFLCALGAFALCSMLRNKPFGFSDRQVAVGCGVYLFMPDAIVYSLFHMPDQMAVTAVLVALWFYFKAVSGSRLALAGFALALVAAIYAKPICLPLSAALILSLVLILKDAWWKRLVMTLACGLTVLACLYPWTVRNRNAFGTAGLTTIAGTNLYACNWGWLVERLPPEKKAAERQAMEKFEATIQADDLMSQSKKKGAYARERILGNMPQYGLFTLKRHPRLYAGTGTVALLRYLGLERVCNCLDAFLGSGMARGHVVHENRPYTIFEKAIGVTVQAVSWAVLLVGYALVLTGIWKGFRFVVSCHEDKWREWLVYLCPILCLVLLAVVIGPVTATRYRFIMLPFFAMLAARAFATRGDRRRPIVPIP